MKNREFFKGLLNSLPQQIAVIDQSGTIEWVNSAWKAFSEENGGLLNMNWRGLNYLSVCSEGEKSGDDDSGKVLRGIEAVRHGEKAEFYFEYPCHSLTEERWFLMRVRPFEWNGSRSFVVSHENITERKLAERKVEEMAVIDSLTGIANRRRFDEFLQNEMLRARRFSHPISLALIDIDFFKPYNDNYGHFAGDECLRRVGENLKSIPQRPDDLVARYGGEEFAIVLGNTDIEAACDIAEKARVGIRNLGISHEHATEAGCITISAGVATARPKKGMDFSLGALIKAADKNLYQAKEAGKDQVFGQK